MLLVATWLNQEGIRLRELGPMERNKNHVSSLRSGA